MPSMQICFVAAPSVRVEVPGVAVGSARGSGLPSRFQQRPPAGVKQFVKVSADADVRVLRHHFQRAVPRPVEAPGAKFLYLNYCPSLPQELHGVVLRTCVEDVDRIRLGH